MKHSARRLAALLATLLAVPLLTTGCATVFLRSTDQLKVVTDPPGATARAGDASVLTPGVLKIPRRKEPVVVRVSKEGFEPREVTIGWSSSGAVWANSVGVAVGLAGTLVSTVCIDVWGGGCHQQTNTTPLLIGAAVTAAAVAIDLSSPKKYSLERGDLVLRLEPTRLAEAPKGVPR